MLACCAHSGSLTDNSKELLSRFEISRLTCCGRERGVKLELINPPEDAFG
ncbi:pyrimidine/purine nucleosidase domain-containing protein [Klebsiella pneumoniae]